MQINPRKEIKIEFVNEEKINDAGGLLREWVHLISKEITNRDIGLFKIADGDEYFYKFETKNELTEKKTKLSYFFGEVCAKAFMDRIIVPISLNHTITRYLLGQQPKLEDLVTYDKYIH